MKLIIAQRARDDVVHIHQYIAKDNPSRAESLVAEIEGKMLGLARMALVFPFMPNHRSQGLRKRSHGPYLIIYRIEGEVVQIVRVLHGSMDIDAQLPPDDL